jgi:hypothetical protein
MVGQQAFRNLLQQVFRLLVCRSGLTRPGLSSEVRGGGGERERERERERVITVAGKISTTGTIKPRACTWSATRPRALRDARGGGTLG